MSKLNLILRLFLSILLVFSIAGCSAGRTYKSTGEHLDDAAITAKINTSILTDSKLKFFQIDVETFKGNVQLSGFVDSSGMDTRAAEVAKKVKGVKMVNNSLIVK